MTKATILTVDDDPTNIEILDKILYACNYRVITASSGDEGLQRLEMYRDIDLILLDWMMPGMDGITFLKIIRSDMRFMYLPVIMQTAAGYKQQVKEALEAGVDDYLVKPYDAKALLTKVTRHLEG